MTVVRYPTNKPFPFSDAVQVGNIIFLSGQVSMTAEGEPLYGSVTQQTQRIMQSIADTLARTQAGLENIFKVQVWLSSMDHFTEFNTAYRAFFPDGFPARSVVTSSLAFNLDVEIEVQAVAKNRD